MCCNQNCQIVTPFNVHHTMETPLFWTCFTILYVLDLPIHILGLVMYIWGLKWTPNVHCKPKTCRTWTQNVCRQNPSLLSKKWMGLKVNNEKKKGHMISRLKYTKPPKNCSHKYNLSIIKFFGNIWTSHLGLFLLVLSIYD